MEPPPPASEPPAAAPAVADPPASSEPMELEPAPTSEGAKPFAAFISHYKAEAAMEARFLQKELEEALEGRRVFLDSDDLHDLTRLREAVVQSDALVLLQSAHVLERPWCLIEIMTALEKVFPSLASA